MRLTPRSLVPSAGRGTLHRRVQCGAVHTESLNFPGRSTPSSPEQIRAEQWALFKERTTSDYVGVSWSKSSEKWMVQITVEGQKRTVGYFDDEVEAARAYDRAAQRYRGPEGRLNFPAGSPNGSPARPQPATVKRRTVDPREA